MQCMSFKRLRIELSRPDLVGELHVDTCHNAVWGAI